MITKHNYPEREFFEMFCNTCDTNLTDDEGDNLFGSRNEALQVAQEQKWTFVGNGHFCTNCEE